MHWVDRGPEPAGLDTVREEHTPSWIEHYREDVGPVPTDDKWGDFRDDIVESFRGLCAYCEVTARGEVDHFRPKSKFPELVYAWSNLVFACHDCNMLKRNKWPGRGYVDPCAKTQPARPEIFFNFDLLTGEILVKSGLSPIRHSKAADMIKDLRLNEFHHLRTRTTWIRVIGESMPPADGPNPSPEDFIALVTDRGTQFSSIARQFAIELGYTFVE